MPKQSYPKAGETAKVEFNYTRHGTVSVTANWDVVRGQIVAPTIFETRDNEGIINRRVMRRGSFISRGDLIGKLKRFIKYFNESNARPSPQHRQILAGLPILVTRCS